ncbi:LuxR C-terminal-related transcriptional regulator [Georgenia faecalis]|uniref:LuxR C-terminal-related transcriptional regulator n=1 Tax=Georgenia faecalis TaxID=2483799 RepID=UPI000FDC0919|nr:LuxR C-terminal-related transcriptional regulator [Georgenia faecalis]
MPIPRIPRAFAPTRAAAAMGRRLPPLVVLRAPRGYGKTSVAASWLASPEMSGVTRSWLTVPEGPVSAADLWTAVHDTWVEDGIALAETVPTTGSLRAVLRRLDRRLVLVIDGLHHVHDTAVDDELVGLVQDHELFHLVVTTRAHRPIERLGPATVDAGVLRVRDLSLDDAETRAFAGRLGLPLTPPEASALRADLIGWPALVRAVVLDSARRPDGSLDIELPPVEHYVGAVLHDADFAPYFRLATALAVPGTFTREDIRRLAGEPARDGLFDDLVEANLVTAVGPGPTYAMAPPIRAAAAHVLEREDPARFRLLHALSAGDGPVIVALEHAAKAGAWPIAIGLVEDHWAELLREHAPRLRDVVARMPDDVVASSARLVLAREHILDVHTAARAEHVLRSGRLTPGGWSGRAPSMTERLSRRSGAASVPRSHLARQPVDEAPVDDEVRGAVPELLVEWSLDQLYAGDVVGAAYGFATAARRAGADGGAYREAATGAAVALALLGHLGDAEGWLRAAAEANGEVRDLERAARPLVEATIATLRLDDAAEVLRVPARSPLAPLVAAARLVVAHGALHRGDPAGGLPEVASLSVTLDPGSAELGLVVRAATSLRCDLHLVAGEYDRCAALLAPIPGLVPNRARHAFYVGAYDEALRLTQRADGDAGLAPCASLELLVIRACAAWRTGDEERALASLSTAVALAADVGVLLPFLSVPRGDLDAIAAGHPAVQRFLDAPRLASASSPYPEPLRASQLSAAERRVLEHLAGPRSLAQVARSLYLSESTVKTHVQRIYRKLGVATRAAAVARARELGLLDDRSGDR